MLKIINFCPTGTQPTRENSLAPIEINEIVEDVLTGAEIGITIVHLHARDEHGRNTHRKAVFQQIIEKIQQYQPELTICVSLSGRYTQEISLRTEVLSLRPDMASLTMSSLNFARQASVNDPDTILQLIELMDHYGVNPEIECFDSGMLNYTNYLLSKGILRKPLYVNVIFGNIFNAQADLPTVAALLPQLQPGTHTCFGGIGAHQLRATLLGLLEADGVRVGLEDNLYFRDREKATNAQLLRRTHALMRDMDVALMPSAVFNKLGYGNRQTDYSGQK